MASDRELMASPPSNTTTWADAVQQGVSLLHEPFRFTVGLPYSLALLAILGRRLRDTATERNHTGDMESLMRRLYFVRDSSWCSRRSVAFETERFNLK